jgi:Ni,Fe-hydrogenase III large subunit
MMDCVLPGGVAADIVPGGPEAIGRALSALAAELPDLRLLPTASGLTGRSGNVRARARERLRGIIDGIGLLRDLLGAVPEGAVSVPLPAESGEGIGFADGASGEIWHWMRLDHGQIAGVFMCDPAWVHWPELEAAMAGGQVDDLPLIMASLGLSSSGADL